MDGKYCLYETFGRCPDAWVFKCMTFLTPSIYVPCSFCTLYQTLGLETVKGSSFGLKPFIALVQEFLMGLI